MSEPLDMSGAHGFNCPKFDCKAFVFLIPSKYRLDIGESFILIPPLTIGKYECQVLAENMFYVPLGNRAKFSRIA